MYRIYSRVGDKEICLHDDTVDSQAVKVGEPKLTLEDSAAGSLTFTLYPNNIAYGGYTYYETEAGETVYLDTIDAMGKLSNGGLDDDGDPIASTSRVKTSLLDIPEGASSVSTKLTVISSTTNILSSLIGPDEHYVMTTGLMAVGDIDSQYAITANVAGVEIDLSDNLYQGVPITGTEHDSTERETNLFNVTSKVFEYHGSYLGNPASFEIEFSDETDVSDIQYMMVAYWPDNEDDKRMYLASTGWQPLRDTVEFGGYGPNAAARAYACVAFKRKDDSELLASSISSLIFRQNPPVQWKVNAYDENQNLIESTGFFNSGSMVEIHIPNQAYHSYSVCRADGWSLQESDVTSAVLDMVYDLEKRLHLYSYGGEHIGVTSWSSSATELDSFGLSMIGQIRMEVRAKGDMPLEFANVKKLDITPAEIERVEVEKTVDYVERMASIISVRRLQKNSVSGKFVEKTIWSGRVIQESTDFYGNRSISCEGELAYLNDTCQPQAKYPSTTVKEYLCGILDAHNAKVPDWKKFYLGQVWCEDTETADRMTTYKKTLEAVNEVISTYGGHIRLRHADDQKVYIDWFTEEFDDDESLVAQEINFGKNLLDFSIDWDLTELSTVLLPTGECLSSGDSTNVGKALELHDLTYGQFLYKDDEGRVHYEVGPELGGYRTAYAVVEPGKNYYFSGRLHGGFVVYTIRSGYDGTGDYYMNGTKTAGSSSQVGFEDFIDYKITIPEGAHSVLMCSFGSDIQLALKEEAEGLDAYLTIEECPADGTWHTEGSLYIVNQEAVNKYGWIENHLALDDIQTKEELYDAAKQYLQGGQFDHITIQLSAIDLNHLGVQAEYVDILDHVRVISEPHGLNMVLPVTQIEIPLDNPAEMKFTIGTSTDPTFTGSSNSINQDILNQMEAVPNYPTVIDLAREGALNLINDYESNEAAVITHVLNDNGEPMELLIVNRADIPDGVSYKETTAPMWRWNMGGLAFLKRGYESEGEDVKIGITRDGNIVADSIFGNYLAGVTLQGCTLISGGLSDRPDIYRRTVVENGYITFEENSSGEYVPTGDIRSDISVQVGDTVRNGIGIHTGVICLDSDGLWVKKTDTSGLDYSAGATCEFRCVGSNGHELRLKFLNGILVEYEDMSE